MPGVEGSGSRVQGSGPRVQGSGSRVQGSGLRVQGLRGQNSELGFRVWRLRVRIEGLGREEGYIRV